ncbi:NAD(P)H-hydrate dehydratase [Burkholderiaceae bacterium DAT-1]|nr:NAD(P)H-hydrate dehydratase [Burkholderiaceae bacterium DAT-1]
MHHDEFLNVATIRQIEREAVAGGKALMPIAGMAAADFVMRRRRAGSQILILVGPGNNGGDGLTAAAHLKAAGYEVTVWMPDQATSLPQPAAHAQSAWLAMGGTVTDKLPRHADLVIDALFGIGFNRPLNAFWSSLIDAVNARRWPVLALDVPSGVYADTGHIDSSAIQATWTLSFIAHAKGLLTGAARNVVGERHLADLGLGVLDALRADVTTSDQVSSSIRLHRQPDSHKGSFGTIRVIGGAKGMVGAALLAGRAALHAGAGKVLIDCLTSDTPLVDCMQPELMIRGGHAEAADIADVLLVGPGLGRLDGAERVVAMALAAETILVLDADALNLIASHSHLMQQLVQRRIATILTPHPAEAARLLQTDTATVQRDRFAAARQLARQTASVVVLKGAGTIIAHQTQLSVNKSGSPALANAGQGDILGGIISALAGQHCSAWEAANLGCLIHGQASDALLRQRPRLVTPASDVLVEAGFLLADYA